MLLPCFFTSATVVLEGKRRRSNNADTAWPVGTVVYLDPEPAQSMVRPEQRTVIDCSLQLWVVPFLSEEAEDSKGDVGSFAQTGPVEELADVCMPFALRNMAVD